MASIAQLRERVRREAVEPAGSVAERIKKLVDECGRLERAARTVLDGAGDGVEGDVAGHLQDAKRAIEWARKALLEARKCADDYEKSL